MVYERLQSSGQCMSPPDVSKFVGNEDIFVIIGHREAFSSLSKVTTALADYPRCELLTSWPYIGPSCSQ